MPLRIQDEGNNGKKTLETLIAEARQEFLAFRTARAKELFEQAAYRDPSHPEVLHGFGIIALREGRYKDAIYFLRQAVEKSPHFAEAWNNLGFALYKKGRYQEACEALERAAELAPQEASCRQSLELLYARLGKKTPKARPLLSLAMIVRNEEQNLKKHFSQMVEFFEDVVVVDTGSQDETKKVAISLGARVFFVPWENDFAKARNEAISRAKGEWILVLDADELVEPEDLRKLRKLILRIDQNVWGMQLPIRNYVQEGKIGVVNFAVRLFRNHRGITFAGRVHETVENSIVERGGLIGRTDIPIHHFGYENQEVLRKKSLERNLPLIEAILEENPQDLQALLYSAKTRLIFLGEREKPRELLLRLIGNPQFRRRPAYIEGLLYLGNLFLSEGKVEIARRLYEKIRYYDPHLPDALFALGNLYFLEKRWEKALETLEGIFDLDPGQSKANLVRFAFTDEILYEQLTRSAIECGQTEKAIRYGEKLRELLPDNPNVLHNLALAYFQGGCYPDAETLWREVLQKDPLHAEARSLLFYLYTLQGRSQEAQSVLQEVTTVI